MSITDKLNRFVTRYKPTLTWTEVNPTVWVARADNDFYGRLVRRHGAWWLYVTRQADQAVATPVMGHRNITKAKRMAEAALAEPWLLDWPVDE